VSSSGGWKLSGLHYGLTTCSSSSWEKDGSKFITPDSLNDFTNVVVTDVDFAAVKLLYLEVKCRKRAAHSLAGHSGWKMATSNKDTVNPYR
jgi:hypothetical protein